MSWVKLDDRLWCNPKVTGLSHSAFRLYIRALCWCAQQETDGKITKPIAGELGTKGQIKELLDANLWHETDAGYEVHDYLVYNPSRADLDARREATRQRVTKLRCNSVTDSVTNAHVTPNETALVTRLPSRPDPVPRSEPPSVVGSAPRPWRVVPESWEPNQEHRQIALEMRVSFELELAKFRDHEFAKPKKDADKAFRNWLRGATPTAIGSPNGRFQRPSGDLPERDLTPEERERNRRLVAKATAELEAKAGAQ